jgi:flagellar biosynthesis protein FliP
LLVLATTLLPASALADPEVGGSGSALAWIAVGALLPLLAVAATAYAKASILLGIFRAGLGNNGVLPALVAPALAASLALVVMAPVGARALEAAGPLPGSDAPIGQWSEAAGRAWPVLESFLRAHTRASDRAQVAELSAQLAGPPPAVAPALATGLDAGVADSGPGDGSPGDAGLADSGIADAGAADSGAADAGPESAAPMPTTPAVPVPSTSPLDTILAFMISELTAAFSLGVLLLLPFLLIDLLVANTLAAVNFATLPAPLMALPFKLLLFVAVDGWALFVRGFVSGYATT